jgi:hypothetical protein
LLGTAVGDTSIEERGEWTSGAGQSRSKPGTSGTSEPLPLSDDQCLEALACCEALWDIAAYYEQRILFQPSQGGRPREFRAVDMLLFACATWVGPHGNSHRGVARKFADEVFWQRLRNCVRNAYADDPTRRLSRQGPSRSQYARFRKRNQEFDEAITRLQEACDEVSARVAETIGAFDPDQGSYTHPAPQNVIGGDATWMRAMYNAAASDSVVDQQTGEITQPRGRRDPDAIPHFSGSQTCGRNLELAIGRTPYAHERVILKFDFLPISGKSDATLFCDMAIALFQRLPGAQAIVYDMALHDRDFDRILDTGRLPISKVQRTRTGGLANMNLGEHPCRFSNRTVRKIPIIAVDGTPCVIITILGVEHLQPLTRRQTKPRKNADGSMTVYGTWVIPQRDEVPRHLRGGQVRIRHNSTPYERANNRRRTRALRPIPESDADFWLFGRREDNEATHNHMKSRLPNGRARCVGITRQTIHLRAYQLTVAVTALIAWHYRTGGNLTPWFGHWRPPNPRQLAAA